jgi:hypothetical protein
MLGKLAGAWVGEKVAKRSFPAFLALALGGWAFRKWRSKRRAHPSYPSDATPSSS